jgi:hypothetical protein
LGKKKNQFQHGLCRTGRGHRSSTRVSRIMSSENDDGDGE